MLGNIRSFKYWLDCKLFKKHRYTYYSSECIGCGKKINRNVMIYK